MQVSILAHIPPGHREEVLDGVVFAPELWPDLLPVPRPQEMKEWAEFSVRVWSCLGGERGVAFLESAMLEACRGVEACGPDSGVVILGFPPLIAGDVFGVRLRFCNADAEHGPEWVGLGWILRTPELDRQLGIWGYAEPEPVQ